MSHQNRSVVSDRVLKLNVGFLLSTGPGHNHDSEIDFPAIKLSDDTVIEYLKGKLRLSRTKEGILVQAKLDTAIEAECYRCLQPVEHEFTLELEDLYATNHPVESEFVIDEDAMLDLSPLIHDEVLIEQSYRVLCKQDCQGLCPICGTNLNVETCDCDRDNIDPRLAALKQLLDD
jgi:uncharacterized protein